MTCDSYGFAVAKLRAALLMHLREHAAALSTAIGEILHVALINGEIVIALDRHDVIVSFRSRP